MQEINLLRPVVEEKKKRAKIRARITSYVALAVIFLLLISGSIIGVRIFLSAQGKSLDQKISNLDQQIGENKQVEENILKFNRIIDQITKLQQEKIAWSEIYKTIANDTPADIRLTKVSLSQAVSKNTASSNSPGVLQITGDTKSRRSIALFADKLEQSGGDFVNVSIISSKKTENKNAEGDVASETTDFEININLKQ